MSELRHSRRQSFQPESTQDTLFEDAVVENVEPSAEHVRHSLSALAMKASNVETSTASEKRTKEKAHDPAETMRELYSRHGFYARDTAEEASMWAIHEHSGELIEHPVADYLFDVAQKQEVLGVKNPLAAPSSILHQFEEHALNADREAKIARLFIQTLDERGATSDQLFSEVYTRDDLKYDDLSSRTLTSVVRRIEDELFAYEGQGKYPLAKRNGIDSLKQEERRAKLFRVFKEMPVSEVLEYTERIRTEEKRRFNYWREQLIQAGTWKPVHAQAAESVTKLNGLRPPKS